MPFILHQPETLALTHCSFRRPEKASRAVCSSITSANIAARDLLSRPSKDVNNILNVYTIGQ